MSKQIGGIAGLLDHLVAPSEPAKPLDRPVGPPPAKSASNKPADPQSKTPSKPQPAKPTTASPPPATSARRGRLPGHHNERNAVPKSKATVWVAADLMEDYRNWSWEARCHLGQLIEQALIEYRKRHRHQSNGKP